MGAGGRAGEAADARRLRPVRDRSPWSVRVVQQGPCGGGRRGARAGPMRPARGLGAVAIGCSVVALQTLKRRGERLQRQPRDEPPRCGPCTRRNAAARRARALPGRVRGHEPQLQAEREGRLVVNARHCERLLPASLASTRGHGCGEGVGSNGSPGWPLVAGEAPAVPRRPAAAPSAAIPLDYRPATERAEPRQPETATNSRSGWNDARPQPTHAICWPVLPVRAEWARAKEGWGVGGARVVGPKCNAGPEYPQTYLAGATVTWVFDYCLRCGGTHLLPPVQGWAASEAAPAR